MRPATRTQGDTAAVLDAARTKDTATLAGANMSGVVKENFSLELAQNRLLQWRYAISYTILTHACVRYCTHPWSVCSNTRGTTTQASLVGVEDLSCPV